MAGRRGDSAARTARRLGGAAARRRARRARFVRSAACRERTRSILTTLVSTSLSLAQATAKLESLAADCAALDARLRDAPSGGSGGGGGVASAEFIVVSIATQLAAAESSRLLDEVVCGFRSRWWRVA